MRIIKFCRINDEYGFLSNFAHYSFKLDGLLWKTSEHYYQAMKFYGTDTEHLNKIRLANNPSEAARLGRDRSHTLRLDWESIKETVMEKALIEKFSQNLDIRKMLIDTGNAQLIEHRKADSYWGDGGDGSGLNRLGALLMKVRDTISN
jgi:hypothetical protein